jgi:tRNA-dihydrouridine synthase A
MSVVLTGGLRTLPAAEEQLARVDGVMLGREAYYNPWMLAGVDPVLFGEPATHGSRHETVEAFMPYLEREFAAGTPLSAMTRHLLPLFQGQPGARAWRRTLSEDAHRPGAGPGLVAAALSAVQAAAVTAEPSR